MDHSQRAATETLPLQQAQTNLAKKLHSWKRVSQSEVNFSVGGFTPLWLQTKVCKPL